MRYLSKVVFINSAHIPLAEVKIDGNVHFIGTQGVGKSTLLRAILFFYNADKQRLGIPKEKSSFDSYYFPYANSYIVYEVMREHGAYCVVAAKSQGRAFFRFIDAPYDRSWFINSDQNVYSDWGRIKEQIGKEHYVSSQITSYEFYRDIIFGNNRRQDMLPFRKFAIVESNKYQNIPRTIQNVFLNTKLDADFIKETIIRSMSDEEVFVDLDYYRNQIKEFGQEYKDVMLWFEKNKNGEITVRKQATKVINTYRDLLYTQKQISDNRAELNYAGKRAEEELPLVRNRILKEENEANILKNTIKELENKHNKERDTLVAQLAVLKDFFKNVREKQNYYDTINIMEITARVQQEELQLDQKKQLEELRLGLTAAYEDVEKKYKQLFDKLAADFSLYEVSSQKRINEKRTLISDRKELLNKQQGEQEEEIRIAFESRLEHLSERVTQIRLSQESERQKSANITKEEPFKKEKTACNQEIEQLDRRGFELQLDIENRKVKISQLRQNFEQEKRDLEWNAKEKSDLLVKEREELKRAQVKLDVLIERRKGSFCEWLEANKPGWKDTIGKIADEDSVLYSHDLFPSNVSDTDSFFGVTLELSNIEKSIRTPQELTLERTELELKIEEYSRQLELLANELATSITELEKKFGGKIWEIKNEQYQMEAELGLVPQKIKYQKAELISLNTKEDEWKRAKIEAIEADQNELASQLIAAEEDKRNCQDERNKKLATCKKRTTDLIKDIEQEVELYKANIQADITQYKKQIDKQKEELKEAKNRELTGKGADIQAIKSFDNKLNLINKELDYIKTNRSLVSDFEKDKRDFFDKELSQKEHEQRLKAKTEDLGANYIQKKELLQLKLKELNASLAEIRKEFELIDSGLKNKQVFLQDLIFSPADAADVREKVTTKSCNTIIDELKVFIFSTNNKTDSFKKAVTLFKGNFSVKNTFNFRMELINNSDFFDFASNLCEFVDNDKIADFKKRISERYIDIIRRISKEVGDLTRNESEIIKTIKEINDDFIKRNFAGVIKEIALQAETSSDKVMQLLLEIKRFNDNNQYNIGEVDLFTQVSREEINAKAVQYLLSFMKYLLDDPSRKQISLSDTFQLKFRVKENDNDTGWVEKIANVGSEGTDILVKAMVNIMLINVFKEKVSRKFGEFKIHCMMDEIGKLHPTNVKGILDFANSRNILLINSSPTTFNAADYRYTYLLGKDSSSNTSVVPLLTNTQK